MLDMLSTRKTSGNIPRHWNSTSHTRKLLKYCLLQFWQAVTNSLPRTAHSRDFRNRQFECSQPVLEFMRVVSMVNGPLCASWPNCLGMFLGMFNIIVYLCPLFLRQCSSSPLSKGEDLFFLLTTWSYPLCYTISGACQALFCANSTL